MASNSGGEEEGLLDLGFLRRGRAPISRSVGLVGKLISDKPYNVFSLIETVIKGFKTKILGNVTAREVERNLIIFFFESTEDRDLAIKYQPWHFREDLLAIATVVGNTKPDANLIRTVDLWTRIYDLPLDDHTEEILIAVAQKIGTLIRYEISDSLNLNSYIRFKIAVDFMKPLRKNINIALDGDVLSFPIRYERLPLFCYGCGLVGHSLQKCSSFDSETGSEYSNLPFAQLKAQAPAGIKGSSYTIVDFCLDDNEDAVEKNRQTQEQIGIALMPIVGN